MPPVTRQVTDVDEVTISQLAREVARDILPTDTVLKRFNLTTRAYETIVDLPFFQRRLEEELAVWNGSDSGSIRQRIAAKAATLIEESLLEVYDMIHNKDLPIAGKVEALKFVARLASMEQGAVRAEDPTDSKVVINIQFNGEKATFTKERSPLIDVTPLAVSTSDPQD